MILLKDSVDDMRQDVERLGLWKDEGNGMGKEKKKKK